MATLTSANSSFVISATQVYPAPQPLQGYAADDALPLMRSTWLKRSWAWMVNYRQATRQTQPT